MKKAFTLLEVILGLIIFSVLSVIILKILSQIYFYHFETLKNQNTILNLKYALLNIDRITQKCLKTKIQDNILTCFLFDKENLLSLKDNQAIIINSTLILKDQNKRYYSPKSNLLIQYQNNKDLFDLNDNFFYALFQNDIDKFLIIDNENLFLDKNITGHYLPLQAKLTLFLENQELKYELNPFSKNNVLKGILVQNISDFIIKDNDKGFKVKLCSSQDDKNLCLEKFLYQ
ncbi:type II secretion system protein [Campylobacter sp. TTU-622]|uniref:type II secretion system protein n=2 Tax=Campylobacter TaxID=194 RepID=UPI0019042DDA|nr:MULTISPECIES: type II secretion system protein [unclassified Campylobacter]MBK1971640.1 type II secretion system protein [Campylobacter sp. TTU_617]MBK1973752.1 type II secretion system protein [Campylobacter sp. TTU-622]